MDKHSSLLVSYEEHGIEKTGHYVKIPYVTIPNVRIPKLVKIPNIYTNPVIPT